MLVIGLVVSTGMAQDMTLEEMEVSFFRVNDSFTSPHRQHCIQASLDAGMSTHRVLDGRAYWRHLANAVDNFARRM